MIGRGDVTIHIGGVAAHSEATIIRTMVGSCIAVCLIDPAAHVGGMNHFMLPASGNGREDPDDRARFGVHAMDLLIGAMQKAGGDRRRLVAKVFGGADVLDVPRGALSVAERNIRFVEEFMTAEGVPIVAADVGGDLPRRIHFYTDTGKAYVKRLARSSLREARLDERRHLRTLRRTGGAVGTIELFDVEAAR